MAKKHKKTKPAKQAAHDNKKGKLSRKYYEQELEKLQGELVKLQFWVRKTGAKVIIVFEGRDAAGKGGVIKRITESTGFQGDSPAGTVRAREEPVVYTALFKALPGGGGGCDV